MERVMPPSDSHHLAKMSRKPRTLDQGRRGDHGVAEISVAWLPCSTITLENFRRQIFRAIA